MQKIPALFFKPKYFICLLKSKINESLSYLNLFELSQDSFVNPPKISFFVFNAIINVGNNVSSTCLWNNSAESPSLLAR